MQSFIVGDKVATLPIVQGGMGIGISLSGLASAVAKEGGVGVISAAGIGLFDRITGDAQHDSVLGLKRQIQMAQQQTDGLIGVNIMVALTNFKELAIAAMEEHADFIFAGAGLPLKLPEYRIDGCTTKLVPIVSSARAARLITKQWLKRYDYLPDAFVLEGPQAGGHLGFSLDQMDNPNYDLDHLLQELMEVQRELQEAHGQTIPIIVGGGIYTGADIHKYLTMGASAVQMATRFVTTEECDASDAFKQSYLDAEESDIVYIKSPVGLPGRAIKNAFLDDVEQGLKHPFQCPYDCIITCKKEEAPYCIALALINAMKGKMRNGFAFAGSNAHRASRITTVKQLIQDLRMEYDQV